MRDRVPRFTLAELARAASVVKREGVAVRLFRDGSILIMPAAPTMDIEDDLDAELQRWEQRQAQAGSPRGEA